MTDFQARVGEFASKHHLAGLSAAVVRDGEVAEAAYLGSASIERGVPTSSSTVYRVGSISKTFTALAVMQLVEDERLTLDDPVNDHLRRYRVVAAEGGPDITARHLLTHTSGIGELRRMSDLFKPFIGMGVPKGEPIPDLGDVYGPALHAEVPAGTKWAYANHAVATLGALIEDLSGIPFDAYLREHVLDPLGMVGSDFVRSSRVEDHLAMGYAIRRGRSKPTEYRDIAPLAAGSLMSSVDDMARYVGALCSDGGGLVKPSTFAEMLEPQYVAAPGVAPMGLSFFLDELGGHRVIGHDGGITGFISAMRAAPDDGVGVLLFTNSAGGKISLELDGLADELLRDALGAPTLASELTAAKPEERDRWSQIVGTYGLHPGLNTNARPWLMVGGEVEILEQGDHLALRSLIGPLRKPIRLVPAEGVGQYTAMHGNSRIQVTVEGGRLHLGLGPVKMTLFRRDHSIRRRARGIAIGSAAVLSLALLRRRR